MEDKQKQTENGQVFPAEVGKRQGARSGESSERTVLTLVFVITGILCIIFFISGYFIGYQHCRIKYLEGERNQLIGQLRAIPNPPPLAANPLSLTPAEDALKNNTEFRKIHDFLNKENPVEFNIPKLPSMPKDNR